MKLITKIIACAAVLLGVLSCSKGDILNGTTWKCTTSEGETVNITIVETLSFETPNFTYRVTSSISGSSATLTGNDEVTSGTYTVDGNKVSMTAKDSDGKDVTYTATVDKTILVLDGRTFTKQK
jgi:hypothetical protein